VAVAAAAATNLPLPFVFYSVLCTLNSVLFMATTAAAEPFHRHCERSECRHNCHKSENREKFVDSLSSFLAKPAIFALRY
jgi:hypothetical protein